MRKGIIGFMMGVLLAMGLSGLVNADTGEFAVSPKLSTLGFGAEVIVAIAPAFHARMGIHGLNAELNGTAENVEYDIDLDLFSGSLLLDCYPFKPNYGAPARKTSFNRGNLRDFGGFVSLYASLTLLFGSDTSIPGHQQVEITEKRLNLRTE